MQKMYKFFYLLKSSDFFSKKDTDAHLKGMVSHWVSEVLWSSGVLLGLSYKLHLVQSFLDEKSIFIYEFDHVRLHSPWDSGAL